MTIYDTSGEVILDAPVTTDAVIRYVLMGDYYIGLPFNLLEPADFPRGSYVMYKGRKFEIMSNVRPEFDDTTGGYKYSLQFWAQQNHMKRRKCKWLQGQNPETTFHDTTDLASFGNLIADNMNAFLGGENWKVAAVPEEFAEVTKLVSFDRDSCWDAINTIAETFDVEWWTVENGAEVWIYFGKLEFGTPEVFKRGDVVTSIPAKKGDDANYGTRFFVFGSTRNLTADYGQAPQGGTTNHVSEVRLRLPNGQEYIDARENLKPADVVEQVVYFEDIYPKNTDTVTSVDRSQDRQTSNGTKYKARIIYAKDTPFVPTDLIEGETLQAVITSGPLSGRTFDIQLGDRFQDPDAWDPERNPFDRKFEIVADIEDAGDGEELIIPNDSLDIDAGDTFVLTGVKLPDERIKEAEQELLKAGKAWAVKNSSNTDVYDCPTNPVYCQRHDKNYDPGQKVLLQDPRFGASGRQSRIQGFEKKLYNEYIATYTVGDNTSYSRLAAIEKDIEESAYAERIGVVNGVGIYLIRSKYDTTLPTDYNAYSALAAETLFLNKRKGGTVLGSTTFDKDITIGGLVTSKDFRQGDFSGSGFGAYRDENGNAVLEADILKIRKEAIFNEAVINQVTFRVGATVFSNGGCEITRVEELETAFRCYYDNREGRRYSGLTAGDQVRCQRYDPTQHAIIKYYWRLVTAVGEDYVELSKSDADGSASPEEGDEIAQFGNRSDITRQSAIVINPLDGGSVEVYAHIDAYSLSEKNYVGMGVNPQTGEAYIYAYGDMFFGDRDLADPNASWITYQKKEGEERRRLRIKADVTFGADSSGLGNLSEFKAQQQQIDDARKEAEEAKKEVGNIQFSAVNLIDGSKSITITAPDGANYTHRSFPINGGVRAGEQLALSVGNIEVLAGTPAGFNVIITDEDKNTWLTNSAELTADNRNAVFSVHADIVAQKALLLIYAGPTGATSGNIVRFDEIMLVRGNKPALSWSPSIADQEKYTDDKVDGIQFSAVNLIDGSKNGDGWTAYDRLKDGVFERDNATPNENFIYTSKFSIIKDEQYTLSLWWKASKNVSSADIYQLGGLNNELALKSVVPAEWTNLAITFKAKDSIDNAHIRFDNNGSSDGQTATLYIKEIMLVRGNRPALSWSPSIADQEKYTDDKVDGIQIGTNIIDGSHADWVAAKENASGYDGAETSIYIDHTLIRGKQITYRVELKGMNAQASQLGFEFKVHFTDNTDQWIPRYEDDIPDRGTFEKTYTFSSQIQDKEIEYARLYPVFRDLLGEPVSGKLYIRHEFVAVGNKIPSTWAPSIADQEEAIGAAQQTADNAAAGVDSLKNFTDEAFADGIVDRAEAAAIGKYTNSVNETRKAADAAYAEVYGNPLLGGTAKSNLQAAKSAFDTAAADLLAAIATAADDGIASPGEQADVDAKYTLFNNAYGTFGTRLEEANKYMLTAVNTASQGALQLSQELQGVVNNINETILPDLQAQIDGSIVSWGGEEVPTLSNYPANQWTSDTERKRHIGDYYDRKTTVDGQAAYERYKFAFENNAYQWVRIADSGGAAAIATAREALGLAGTKARIFFGATTPAVPYSVNDVWFRSSGSGAALETTVYISNADKGQQETASAADWQLVDDSQVRLRQMSSDGVISREEKASLRNRLAQIQEAYTSYQNDAATYGVSIADLAAAYSALVNFLTGTVAVNNDTDTTLSAEQRSAYNAAFAAYDAEVSRFSNLVADAISQGKVDDIQFSAVNLIDNSKSITVTAPDGANYTHRSFPINGGVRAGEQLALSVGNIEVLAGTPAGFNVIITDEDKNTWLTNSAELTADNRNAVFSVHADIVAQKALLLIYAGPTGATSGNIVRFDEIMLVRGNKPALSWSPSIADQEKYTDETAGEAVNGVETQIDASKLDQNTYYPVTIELNGIARSKITVRVNLSDTQPGNPAWATYSNSPGRFSCQAVWYNNGNGWGSNYHNRVVEEYQYRWTDTPPIGSVGQMAYSSNEYIYVRGGGVYRFFATNAGTPVLHTEAYTVNEQTVDLKTSVEPLVSLQEQANSTQQEAETTRQAIADMNDDTIFDVSEKQSIRTQWENISGYARTDVVLDSLSATNGSYYRVRDMAKAAGISTAGLLAAVNSLRVKLNDYALYTASNTPGFDRAGLAVLFTAYYAQEIDVLNAVSQKYTDGKVADIETTMQDYDYLKLVFPNNTVDNNGVFLSRLMAVKNGTSASAAVVAGLYGGGVDSLNNAGFKDATHGILMMFAGATSIQNVAAAKTRIYGDGALFTDKLYATGGNIGNFTITDGYLSTYKNNVGMELANDRFLLGIKSGSESLAIAASLKAQYRMQTVSSYEVFRPYCSIEYVAPYTRAAMPRNVALEIDAAGAARNATKPNVADLKSPADYALLIHRGTTAGLRFYSRKVSSGQTNLSLFDMFVYADTSGGSAIFMLPDNPPPNQFYLIRKLKAANKVIVSSPSSSKDLIYPTGNDGATQKIEWTGRRAGILQYSEDLGAWVLEFTYEA